MVDGNVCNTLTDTRSSQTCFICGTTDKLINIIDDQNYEANNTNYSYGISTLNAWIRTLECLLHIGYRITIKKWQIRGNYEKEELCIRKTEIQKNLKVN